ncbi:MAG TPA: hypothetical protein VFS47_06350 [Steroidobacteraceae bacterium]|nr:hypothetical protein [Steroidobacteraceae bacterium]
MKRPPRVLMCVAALMLVCASPEGFCNWGLDVGRASPTDANRLAVDKLALKEAESRYNAVVSATQQMMVTARQRQLLGSSGDTVGELYRRTYLWWLKSVLEPAALIATNPAATCAEARMGYRRYVEMQRQRQFIGLATDPDDRSSDAEERRGENNLLEGIGEEIHAATLRRCHEEALDECVETGRYMALFEEALIEKRQSELLDRPQDISWLKDALDQCARYELRFSSTGGAGAELRTPGYTRTVEGTVQIQSDPKGDEISPVLPGIGGLVGSTQSSTSAADDLYLDDDDEDSEDAAASNPFLSAHECVPSKSRLATLVITSCGPGHADARHPTRARIQFLDLKHIVYELDANEAVTTSEAGQDKLVFDFEPGAVRLPLSAHWKSKLGPTDSFDLNLEVFQQSYGASHAVHAGAHTISIQRTGSSGPALELAEHARRPAGYPDLFVTTLTGAGRCTANVPCNDKTEFTLTHKPQPKPFGPRNTELQARIDALISAAAQEIAER